MLTTSVQAVNFQNVWITSNALRYLKETCAVQYICFCVLVTFLLSRTRHPQRLMSLNTAQSELIKETIEAGWSTGRTAKEENGI